MEKEISLDVQTQQPEKKPMKFFKNKLNYSYFTLLMVLLPWALAYNLVLSRAPMSFPESLPTFFGIGVWLVFINTIKKRNYLHTLLSLTIFPIAYFISSLVIPDFSFTIPMYHILGLIVCIIGMDIVLYFFPFGYLQSILVIAANSVKSTQDGYTTRPFSTGESNYTKEDAINFVKYMSIKMQVTSYLYEDKAVLLFRGSFHYLPFIKPNYERYSYKELNYDGSINVHVGSRDYTKYKDELTYNKLCNSFGDILKRFFAYYVEGNKKLIGKELKRYRYQH